MSGGESQPRVIIAEGQVRTRVLELARQITSDYDGRVLDVVCTLNGAAVFSADLVRDIGVETRQHYLGFTGYGRGGSSGEARITLDIAEPLEDRHVLVVEGAVISGRTPRYIMEILKLRQPKSIALCALIVKPRSLVVDLSVQYVGFELGDEMACGYGIGHGSERALRSIVDLQSAH